MPTKGQGLLNKTLALWFCFLGASLGAKEPVYETVLIAPGEMVLEIPLNQYMNTDFLKIPVTLSKPFRIGRYEVTRRLWQACHVAGACEKPALPAEGAGPEHPMVMVNWHEAREFTRWWSERTGQRWRLPTEGEWFYVASDGKGWRSEEKRYDYSNLDKIRETPKVTLRKGAFGANAWGVYDLRGNVWEWTLSCYVLAADRLLQPVNVDQLDDPEFCTTRVTGGEHRAEVPDFVSDTYQGGCSTLKPAANLGFRMVLEP